MKLASPLGELMWITYNGEGREDQQGNMKYLATVVMPKADAQAITDKLDKFWDDNRPKAIKVPKTKGYRTHHIPKLDKDGKPEIDPETDKKIYVPHPDGLVEMVFKTGTTWPDGKSKHVTIYDYKGNKSDLGDIQIGNGSTGVIHGAAGIYTVGKRNITDAGVTLYLNGIQLQKLVEYSGGDDVHEMAGGEELPSELPPAV